MVATNAITALSYLSICLTLLYLTRRTRRVIARDWAWFLVGFALFIVACGSTHLMEVVTTWVPWFWLDATANLVTAALSAYVAVMLINRAHTIAFSINDYAARLASNEMEKQRMMESLLSAQKLEDWSRMSTVLAHEIANPLEAVNNLLYVIRTSKGVSPEVVGLAHTAASETDRVLTISRATLSFFRQGSEPESTDLRVAAESVRFLVHGVLEEKRVSLAITAEGDLKVMALPGEARQVMLNLIRNAVEASPRDGEVRVLLTGEPEAVQVAVNDRGSGIDAAVQPHLFQFGYTSKGERGNGLGLWSVRQILGRHGGEIAVKSSSGMGTTFTLSWPRSFGTAR
jgi:signal transduction histidine kinase